MSVKSHLAREKHNRTKARPQRTTTSNPYYVYNSNTHSNRNNSTWDEEDGHTDRRKSITIIGSS